MYPAPGYEETWGHVLPGLPSRALPPSVRGALPPFSPPAPPRLSRPALRGRPGPLSLGLRLRPAVGERRAQTTPLASRPAWGLPPSRARTLHPAPPGSRPPGGAGRGQSPPPALGLLRLRPAAPLPSPPRPAPPWQSLAPRPCDPAAGPGRDGTRRDRRRGSRARPGAGAGAAWSGDGSSCCSTYCACWSVSAGEAYLVYTDRLHSRSDFNTYVAAIYKVLGTFLFGAAVSQSLTDLAKYTVGRLRPNFLAVCDPDWSRVNCSVYVQAERVCRGSPANVTESRLSFYSGHSSFGMYCMLFLAVRYVSDLFKSRPPQRCLEEEELGRKPSLSLTLTLGEAGRNHCGYPVSSS
ncbi:phospholipid phosphatase 2 isoform X2 [Lutra lutra]|uniref:phospholipid phosphatase 2 isoform X2 n=1 Tax=Lutra lutra TaxID=9657 RepID=UPI001FD36F3B|nr:phospholipid phosphatase 2 isoform X2 [Lutra lutra]